jgi:hypothetical protein
MGDRNELTWGYSTHHPDEQERSQAITEPRRNMVFLVHYVASAAARLRRGGPCGLHVL